MSVSYMSLATKPGDLIRFHAQGGYDAEQESAKKLLTLGATYEVLEMNVVGFSSRVRIEAGWFNTCLFENFPKDQE